MKRNWIACWFGLVLSFMPLSQVAAMSGMGKAKSTDAVSATLDARGALWLVTVSDGQLWVQKSADGGPAFDEPRPVLASPEKVVAEGEARPLLAVADDGTLLLTWPLDRPERKYSGDVRFARSTDGGRTWSAPLTLNDDGKVTSHRFASIATDGRGRFTVAWLDGRDRDAAGGKEAGYNGTSIYSVSSSDNGAHFAANRRVAEHTCECCRTAMTWSASGPVVLWRNLYGTNTRDFALAELDSGKVVRATVDDWKLDGCPHHGGGLAEDGAGRLHFVWFTQGERRQGLFYANRGGDTTSTPIPLGQADNQPGHADVAAHGRTVLVTWREFDGQRYAAMAMRSDDGGATFQPAQRVADTTGAADYPLPLVDATRALVVWRTAGEGVRVLPVAAPVKSASAEAALAP